MKTILKKIFRDSKTLLKVNALLNDIRYNKVLKEHMERGSISLFDYKNLSVPIPCMYVDSFPENNLYGLAYTLKNMMKINRRHLFLNSYVEHGLFFGKYVAKLSYMYDVDKIVTFGEFRSNVLKESGLICDSEIIEIGPYIAYAEKLLDDTAFLKLKQKLGKTLLVFPTHSIENMTTDYDNDELCSKIEEIREIHGYNTIMISLYWKDILEKPELCQHYEDRGYRIVCSGHKNDINFLNRQRTFIELADMTMSNEAGTHIGYCLYLNKPHFVYKQKITFKEGYEQAIAAERMDDELTASQLHHRSLVEEKFTEYSELITQSQKDIVEYYWGLSKVKSKQELTSIFR
ncbi:hypothetical protein M1B74_11545 [Bacteroides pyogenes]|uniref:hypothetical protein n=1 Tax=Bacteroides pyogenes TaxID=310300 RepID=UPI003B427E4F